MSIYYRGKQGNSSFNSDKFNEVIKKAQQDFNDPEFAKYCEAEDYFYNMRDQWPREPGSADDDPRGHVVKPKGKTWKKPPQNEQEEYIYYGYHIHDESNFLGLHSHFPNGPLTGAHGHSPANKFGAHTHMPIEDVRFNINQRPAMYQLDGEHVHNPGENHPSGKHIHCPENFA